MNPERQNGDMTRVRRDILQVLDGLEAAVSAASDEELGSQKVLAHLKTGVDEVRTPQNLLEGLFARHWNGHTVQLRELRAALGL
jgi:hypothetical protein